jgi:hypothetical protein
MWKARRLELRDLCDLGRWLLEDSEAKAQFDLAWRQAAFEACNSPTEWEEFLAQHQDDPRTGALMAVYRAIDARNQQLPRAHRRQPVILPQLDW